MLRCAAAATLFYACGKPNETFAAPSASPTPSATPAAAKAPPPVRRAAIPRDHSFEFESGLVATDLKHGEGTARLTMMRRWSGSSTLNGHFGAGWSDQNHVRLGLVSQERVLVWRGGIGAQTAYRIEGNRFQTDQGENLERTEKGWTLRTARGGVLTFGTDGRLQSEKPAAGPALNYEYEKNGRLVSLGTSAENSLRYSYDTAGRVIAIDGPEKLRVTYRYDDKGRLGSVTNVRQVQIDYRYSDDGELLGASDNFGNEVDLASTTVRLLPAASAATAVLPATAGTKFEFDEKGFVKSAREGGETQSFQYDQQGRLTAVESARGRATCKYDGFGRIIEVREGDGRSLRFEYNNLDLPTLIAKPDGTTETLRYDVYGQLVRRERSPTNWEEFSYDGAGRLEVRRRAPGAEERYVYGEDDRIARTKYSDGREAAFEYDPDGRILSESWTSGEKRKWRYDANGRLVETVSPAGLKTTYTYDARGQLIASEDRLHGKTSHRANGRESTTETAAGKTVTTTSEWGKPLTVVEPGGARTLFQYGPEGQLELLMSPLKFAWRYGYDRAGNLASIKAPSGLQTALAWDGQGRQTKVTRGDVVWRNYRYDAAGRLEQEYSGLGSVARYTYDSDGRRSAAEFPDGKVTYTHGPDGLRASTKGPGYEVEEEYRTDGGLARRKYQPGDLELKLPIDTAGRSGGIELNTLKATYTYDARGQIEQIALPGGATIKVTIDEAGRPAEIKFGNKLVQKIGYDRADRITSIEATQGAAKPLFGERYTYDTAGNLSQRTTDSNPPVKFSYDDESRLTTAAGGKTRQTFAYDVDGNLKTDGGGTARFQIDNLGRPTQRGAVSYSWDAGGNLSSVQNAGATVDHVFDAAGRLTERRDGKKGSKFGYLDGPDRLWQESAAGKRWYVYAGDRLAGFKDEGGVTWLVVYLPETDRPLAFCGSNGQTLFVLHDRLGSARRFVDASGTVVARDDYAPFGHLEASEGKPPLQLFAGMLRDENGLFYARHRYYDPAIGRFISLDPLVGTLGIPSSHNAYGYAANNPLRYRDPMGTGSFEDEIVNNHEAYDYVWKKDPRDPTGNTLLRDANGDPVPERHQSGPFKNEPIVDKSKPPTPIKNNQYDALTGVEQRATREAYEGAKAARQAMQNPASSAQQAQAAAQALARHEAELARLNEVGRLRAGHAVMLGGERAGWGGAGSQERMLSNEKRLAELGADPFGHYSPETQAELRGAREHQAQIAADAAARDARAQGAFGRGSKTQQVGPGSESRSGTGQVNPTGETGSGTSQVNPGRDTGSGTGQVRAGSGEGPARGGTGNTSDVAARAREKIERSLKNNEAIILSREERAAYEAEEAARKAAAAKPGADTSLVKGAGEGAGARGGAGSTSGGTRGGTSWDEELFTGKSPIDKTGRARDIEMVYDAKNGNWRPKTPPGAGVSSVGTGAGGTGERWLGPKILETGGKIVKPLGPALKVMGGIDAAVMGGKMAQNFIDTLNEPFARAQLEKAGARWLAERYANELRQLAHADPDAVITRDGRKFDPNNPRDMEELLFDLGQNLFFGRKPFEGLLSRETNKPTAFMGAAPGDTAAATTMAEAWRLMKEAVTLEKDAGKFAAEILREEEDAKAQLKTAMTIAGTRAVAESDIATVPEAAEDVRTQTAKVTAQGKAAQTAFEDMTTAVEVTDDAATKICGFAEQAATATEEQVAQWRTEATSTLFAASNALNAAQAKIDNVVVAVDDLRAAITKLEGFRTALDVYKFGGGVADAAGATPDSAFTAAKAAAERASQAREKLGPMLVQVRGLAMQVSTVLAPYLGKNVEADALDADARTLGAGIEMPSLVDVGSLINLSAPMIEAALNNQRAVENAIAKVDIAGIVSAANEALTEADAFRLGASTLATGSERYRALQTASQCFALIKFTPKIAEATPSPTPADDEVVVPDLSVFDGVAEMKAIASHAGLVPALAATSATPPPGSKRLFAGQDPAPNARVKKGTPLRILVYQTAAQPSPTPTAYAAVSPTPTEDEVRVPDLAVFDNVSEMKTALAHNGLVGAFSAKGKPPSKEMEFKFAGQSPAADSKVKRGSTVAVSVYQKFEGEATTAATSPTPSPQGRTADGTMPNLVGLTLDQASTRLTNKMRIGGDEVGDKPPTPEKAMTIYAQNPAAGTKIDATKEVVVTVKRYGSAAAAATPTPATLVDAANDPFVGTWKLGTSTHRIERRPDGYVWSWVHKPTTDLFDEPIEDAKGAEKSGKAQGGKIENGRLVFRTSESGVQTTYYFKPEGNELRGDFQMNVGSGTKQRGSVKWQRQK